MRLSMRLNESTKICIVHLSFFDLRRYMGKVPWLLPFFTKSHTDCIMAQKGKEPPDIPDCFDQQFDPKSASKAFARSAPQLSSGANFPKKNRRTLGSSTNLSPLTSWQCLTNQ